MIAIKILVAIYLVMTLVLGVLALLLNKKSLLKMSLVEQFMFFTFQPFLYTRELIKGKNNAK